MPNLKKQVKREIRVSKIIKCRPSTSSGRKITSKKCNKETELSAHGRAKHITNTSLVGNLCDSQSRREELPISNSIRNGDEKVTSLYIPVVSSTGKALMPCHPARARELVKSKKAIRRFKCGIFYIKLIDRKEGNLQKIACGIDPGSKREGFTVKTKDKTLINILSNAVDTVKDKIESRRNARIARRARKTPCRKNKTNRSSIKTYTLSHSTKARWDAKLRIINILRSLYPIDSYVIEDIKAITKKGKRKWNVSFSPLETGKKYFYNKIKEIANLALKAGHETAKMRKDLQLNKDKNKLKDNFWVHNVDSWVLANSAFYKEKEEIFHKYPENRSFYRFVPLNFARRQLHVFIPVKGGKRKTYGGTISLGIVRGTVIKHNKYGICYVGGSSNNKISIHHITTGERLFQNILLKDINILYKQKWRVKFIC
jgi:hypothetical protein